MSRPQTPTMGQQQPEQPGMRLMQVKVLYTFNDDAKSNCLARCPQPLHIQTAKLDHNTEIGIIELRTCIQAIAATSPELVATLGQDYTVYAYDYSEYETPQVGQGMLSWILANASSTPTAPAHQSRTMVTGRVCRNVLGLFSGGSSEALEVKLRLVPVPTALQSEYLASLEKYRSAGPPTYPAAGEQGSGPAAWSSFMHTSPEFSHATPVPPASHIQTVQPIYAGTNNNSRRASFSDARNLSSSFDPTHHSLTTAAAKATADAAANQVQSRPTTPSLPQTTTSRKRANTPSRPNSRTSNRGGRPRLKKTESCISRLETMETSEAEEGPQRKRARVTQADWNGSSNFGSNVESLRVTAATAASIRGHRPMANNALTSDIIAGEVGERPPTPRPRQRLPPRPVPTLDRALTTPAHELHQPHPMRKPLNKNDPLGILDSSPEKSNNSSTGSSPVDLPSSPPIVRHASPALSSPSLPKMPAFTDSGFASGNLDEFLPGTTHYEEADDHDYPASRSTTRVPNSTTLPTPTEPAIRGPKLLPGPAPAEDMNNSASKHVDVAIVGKSTAAKRIRAPKSRAQSIVKSTGPGEDMREGDPQMDQADVALLAAALPADDRRVRSESLPNDASSGFPIDGSGTIASEKRKADHQKKKQTIQVKLQQSITSGQMPRFCKNCGEISTPSWRKAFVKTEHGDPKDLTTSEAETGIHSCEVIERDGEGESLSYRIVKRKLASEDQSFEEIDLCNPCGVWLDRHRCMRPSDQWDKPPSQPAVRRQSTSKPPVKRKARAKSSQPLATDSIDEPKQDVGDQGDPSSVASKAQEQISQDQPLQSTEDTAQPPARRKFQRSNSVDPSNLPMRRGMKKATAEAALQRAIQSSPPRFPGSRVSPIDLSSDSPIKPTKRLLFPSPRKPGELKSLDPASDKQVSPIRKVGMLQIFDAEAEKENRATIASDDDGLRHLFDDDTNMLKTPKAPARATDPHKTPSRNVKRTPLGSKSSHSRRHSNPETPSRSMNASLQATPFSTRLARLLSDSNNGLEGGLTMSPFTSQAMNDIGMFDFGDLNDGSNTDFPMYDDASMQVDDSLWNTGFYHASGETFLQHHGPFEDTIGETAEETSLPTSGTL